MFINNNEYILLIYLRINLCIKFSRNAHVSYNNKKHTFNALQAKFKIIVFY